MQCVKPIRIKGKQGTYSFKNFSDGMYVPCGRCIACRIRKREEWTIRLLHELKYHADAVFVTLTYNDESLPINEKGYQTLRKKHLQDFFKRLRINLDRDYHHRKIKYFACGEYGDCTGRPHYHMIILGLSLRDKELISLCWPFSDWNGIHMKKCFGTVTRDSIRYVAKYIEKRLLGDSAKEDEIATGKENTFRLSSKGIGELYCREYADNIIDKKYITDRGIKMGLPRYYIDKLGITKEDMIDVLFEKQKEVIDRMSGAKLNYDEAYRRLDAVKNVVIEKRKESARHQREKNLIAKSELKKNKL